MLQTGKDILPEALEQAVLARLAAVGLPVAAQLAAHCLHAGSAQLGAVLPDLAQVALVLALPARRPSLGGKISKAEQQAQAEGEVEKRFHCSGGG